MGIKQEADRASSEFHQFEKRLEGVSVFTEYLRLLLLDGTDAIGSMAKGSESDEAKDNAYRNAIAKLTEHVVLNRLEAGLPTNPLELIHPLQHTGLQACLFIAQKRDPRIKDQLIFGLTDGFSKTGLLFDE